MRCGAGPESTRPGARFLFRLAAAALRTALARAFAAALGRLFGAGAGFAGAIAALAGIVLGDVRHGDLLGLGCWRAEV